MFDLKSVLYSIALLLLTIFSLMFIQEICYLIWLCHEDMDQFMKCRAIDPFMELEKLLLFILFSKYIIVHKILEVMTSPEILCVQTRVSLQ